MELDCVLMKEINYLEGDEEDCTWMNDTTGYPPERQ